MELELGTWEHILPVDLVRKERGLQRKQNYDQVMELAPDQHTREALCEGVAA